MTSVYVFGSGDCGQLGLGEDVDSLTKPKLLPYFEGKDIIQISAGGLHNLALSSKGEVYSWGCNDEKALGHCEPEWSIGLVSELVGHKIVKISCGDSISAAVTDKGKIFAWGTFRDSQGVLGYSEFISLQSKASLIIELESVWIVDVAAGANHLIVISKDGQLYSWGSGEQGQLGRRVLERHKLKGLRPQNITPRHLKEKLCNIACGSYHSLALSSEGSIYSWGLNNYGQLGLGDMEARLLPSEIDAIHGKIPFISLAAGEHHSIGLTANGMIYSWGRGDSGQLGRSLSAHVNIPTPIPMKPKVVLIASGGNHCLAVDEHSSLYSWGFNDMGQLGNGTEEDSLIPWKIPFKHAKILQIEAGGQHSLILVK